MSARTYDSKCHELAQYFGADELLSTPELHELASDIQEAVESFFSERERRRDRAMSEPEFRGGEYAAHVRDQQVEAQKLK